MRNILNMRILSRLTMGLYLSDMMHSLAGAIDHTTSFYIYMIYATHTHILFLRILYHIPFNFLLYQCAND